MDVELYEALVNLTDEAFVDLVARAQVDRAVLPAAPAALAVRADALARMAANDPQLGHRLRDVLGERVRAPDASLRRWLEHRLAQARTISVPGPDTELSFDATSLVVPLELNLRTRDDGHIGFAPEGLSRDVPLVKVDDFRGAFRVAEKRTPCVGVAVVGDPGSGKTTLLQQIYCKAYPTTNAELGLPPGLTPVLVNCRTINELGADSKTWTLLGLIEAQATLDGYAGTARGLQADERPLLLLLDGLDEVADEAQRVRLATWLKATVLPLRERGWRFVVTSRYATWNRETALSDALLTADALSFDKPALRAYPAWRSRFVAGWADPHTLGRTSRTCSRSCGSSSRKRCRRFSRPWHAWCGTPRSVSPRPHNVSSRANAPPVQGREPPWPTRRPRPARRGATRAPACGSSGIRRATSGWARRSGVARLGRRIRPTTRRDHAWTPMRRHRPPHRCPAWCGVVPGATLPGTCGPRSGAGATRGTGASSSGSGSSVAVSASTLALDARRHRHNCVNSGLGARARSKVAVPLQPAFRFRRPRT